MNASQCPTSPSISRTAMICALAVVSAGILQIAGANPLPMGGTYFHVQPVDPQFCDPCPITQCHEIVQHTTATGVLEFDLFLDHVEFYWGGRAIYAVNCEVAWSPALTLLEHEICGGGVGSLTPTSPRAADLEACWPACPVVQNRVWPVARFIFQVEGHGAVAVDPYDLSVTLGCPPDHMVETGLGAAPGWAGVECEYCDTPCGFDDPCHGRFLPASYDVQLMPGQSTDIILNAVLSGHWGLQECSGNVTASADWLEPLESWLSWMSSWQQHDLAVRVNAAGLDPGFYQAWVRIESDCVGCARINLIVGDWQGVPEGDTEHPASPKPPIPTSWGRLKQLHR